MLIIQILPLKGSWVRLARTATGSAASPFWEVAIAVGHLAFSRKKIAAAVGIFATSFFESAISRYTEILPHFVQEPIGERAPHSSQETPEVLKLHPKPEGARPVEKIMDIDQDRVSFSSSFCCIFLSDTNQYDSCFTTPITVLIVRVCLVGIRALQGRLTERLPGHPGVDQSSLVFRWIFPSET